MQHDDVLSYGVTEQSIVASPIDSYAEEIVCKGYTTVDNVFSPDEVARARQLLDELNVKQVESFGSQNLEKANDANILRCPLAYDDHFLSMATHKTIHAIITQLLGNNYVLMMQNGIINKSDVKNYQVRWHRDLNYQHWTSSRPLVLNFLIALDTFSFEGGATMALPGSHRYEKFPSNVFVSKHETCLEALPGSVIIMDGMTYHRAGINTIPGFTRRGVNHVVGLPFMGQQIDIPNMLAKRGKDLSNDSFLSSFLGYRWNPALDVEKWRQQRLRK